MSPKSRRFEEVIVGARPRRSNGAAGVPFPTEATDEDGEVPGVLSRTAPEVTPAPTANQRPADTGPKKDVRRRGN